MKLWRQYIPSIDTLVEDIERLFDDGHTVLDAHSRRAGAGISGLIKDRLEAYGLPRANALRVSNLGRPDRQVWYEINDNSHGERLPANVKLKFLFGDMWEQVLLLLAREAGHEVSHEQDTIDVAGVSGHPDAIIDGVVVDIKSCSSYAFKKFKDGTLRNSDAFGYLPQLAGYVHALTPGAGGAFLAVDKTTGSLCLMKVDAEELAAINIVELAEHKKRVVAGKIPERCYEDVPDGKSGNRKLAVGCSYCAYKSKCWSDSNGGNGLRTFFYSSGPTFLTHVERVPQVFEVGAAEVEFEF